MSDIISLQEKPVVSIVLGNVWFLSCCLVIREICAMQ